MRKSLGRICCIGLLLVHLLAGTARAFTKPVIGLASWYGKAHQGKKMANGQNFDSRSFTAAHRSLPFGTRVKVTCLRTGKSVWVTITDRGPWKNQRLLDLSEAAAELIGLKPLGVSRVRMEESF